MGSMLPYIAAPWILWVIGKAQNGQIHRRNFRGSRISAGCFPPQKSNACCVSEQQPRTFEATAATATAEASLLQMAAKRCVVFIHS